MKKQLKTDILKQGISENNFENTNCFPLRFDSWLDKKPTQTNILKESL